MGCKVDVDGRRYQMRHGVGRRECFGRLRVHTVTWLNRQPVVEGAEAEDYPETHAVVSVIKARGKDVVDWGDLPVGYENLTVVRHRNEVRGPFARRALAVKLHGG